MPKTNDLHAQAIKTQQRRITLADGRYLIFFTFDGIAREHPQPSQGQADTKELGPPERTKNV